MHCNSGDNRAQCRPAATAGRTFHVSRSANQHSTTTTRCEPGGLLQSINLWSGESATGQNGLSRTWRRCICAASGVAKTADTLRVTPARTVTGRVEMWRGGGRSDISVAAPFVWRCLSGSTVAPFPHPAHRTGRADFPHPALGQDSRLRPRHVAAERGQAYEREVPVEVREWISPAPASSDLMLEAQPPA